MRPPLGFSVSVPHCQLSCYRDFVFQEKSPSLSSPLDKEGLRLDTMGRKIYTSAALGLQVANFKAIVGRYQMLLWERMSQHLESLLENKMTMAKLLQAEDIKLGKLEYL